MGNPVKKESYGPGLMLALILLIAIWFGYNYFRYGDGGSRFRGGSELVSPVPVLRIRTDPIHLIVYPVENLHIDRRALESALHVSLPISARSGVPVSLITHAFRLWRCNSNELLSAFAKEGRAVLSSTDMQHSLLDHNVYLSICGDQLPFLLNRTQFGVQAISTEDEAFSSKWGLSHIGELIETFAEAGLPSTETCTLNSGEKLTIADIVRDDLSRTTLSSELEWVTVGLSRYLVDNDWTNRFDEPMNFDRLAEMLINRPAGSGACVGTHIPYALSNILLRDRTSACLSDSVRQRAIAYFQKISLQLVNCQQDDGSWRVDWWQPQGAKSMDVSLWGSPELDAISTTAHHLEWMMIVPDELRPPSEVVIRASQYLVRELPGFDFLTEERWVAFAPLSHASHALILASGFVDPVDAYNCMDGKSK